MLDEPIPYYEKLRKLAEFVIHAIYRDGDDEVGASYVHSSMMFLASAVDVDAIAEYEWHQEIDYETSLYDLIEGAYCYYDEADAPAQKSIVQQVAQRLRVVWKELGGQTPAEIDDSVGLNDVYFAFCDFFEPGSVS